MAAVVRNRFYSVFALVLALVVVAGFTRTFYARPLFDLPPMPTMLQIHGAVFTAWLLLFFTQTRLIARHNYKAHMTLGIVGALLALLVVIFGVITAFQSSLATRPRGMGLTSPQFIAVPLTIMVLFTVFVGTALLMRHRPAIHKRFMVLAMISVLGPAVARLMHLAGGDNYFLLIQTSVTAAFVAWCLASDWRNTHSVHPVYLYGGAFLILSWPLRVMVAQSDAWAVVSAKIVHLMS